jgi:hypothetical protein
MRLFKQVWIGEQDKDENDRVVILIQIMHPEHFSIGEDFLFEDTKRKKSIVNIFVEVNQ